MIGNLFAFYVLIQILYENVFTPIMACMGPPPRGAGWVTLTDLKETRILVFLDNLALYVLHILSYRSAQYFPCCWSGREFPSCTLCQIWVHKCAV